MAIDRVETYNPVDMSQISSDVTGLDFGGIIRGGHCVQALVIKPVLSGTITQLALFLEAVNGYTNAQFGYFASKEEVTGIQPGSVQMSNHFTEDPGVSNFITSDRGVSLDPTDPEFVWLDAQVGLGAAVGTGTINYRFVFEYN